MQVSLIGTGARQGLPVAGCPCASCRAAELAGPRRAALQVRVDGGAALGAPGEVQVGDEWLLWAPDGLIPAGSTPCDVVLLGLARGLTEWGLAVAQLRRDGRCTDRTVLCAVGVDHAAPPADELEHTLAAWGATAPRDGDVVESPAAHRLRLPRVLVLGGTRSGKSAYAELRLMAEPEVVYVATAPEREDDPEWLARVQAHVQRRPAAWETVETGDVAGQLRRGGPVVVDDLGLWLVRVLDACDGWTGSLPEEVDAASAELVAAWAACTTGAVLAAPLVGSGVVPATASGRLFCDLLGSLTARLAAQSDEVVEVVAGLPRRLR